MLLSPSWKMVMGLGWNHRFQMLRYFAVLIAGTAFEGFGLGMLLPLMQVMNGEVDQSLFTRYAKTIFEYIGLDFNFSALLIVFVLFLMAKYLLHMESLRMARRVSARIGHNLRERAFQNLLDLPLSYFYQVKTGDLVATQFTSAQNAAAIFEYGMTFLNGMLFCMLYLSLNFLLSPSLTIVVLVVAGLSYYFIVPRLQMGFIKGDEEKTTMDSLNSYLIDTFSGVKTLKVFDNSKLHTNAYMGRIERYRDLLIEIMDNRVKMYFFNEPMLVLLAMGLLFVAVKIFGLSFSAIVVFFAIFFQILPKLKAVNNNWLAINEFLPHMTKVFDLIDTTNKMYMPVGTFSIDTFENEISLENISFRYPGKNEDALSELSAKIPKGATIALVGGSGGGKTTFVDLLLRLHEPTTGIIKVDGRNLQDIQSESWRSLLGVVDQDPYLFNDTVYNNICYGKPDATKLEIEKAAEVAYATEFIDALPEGYQTLVGNRGINLSGGQKQRLALARALVRNPQILVMDEATSALDSEFENLIQIAIRKLRGRVTIVIVAHRLSTVRDADKIFVIENSRLLEEGTHDDLMRLQGRYRSLVDLQTQNRA